MQAHSLDVPSNYSTLSVRIALLCRDMYVVREMFFSFRGMQPIMKTGLV